VRPLFAFLLVALITGCSSSYDNKTPAGLLKTIHSLAQKEDYAKLKEYIFPFTVERIPQELLQGIREKATGGDGAYSHQALALLIDKHLDKLQPAQGRPLEWCLHTDAGGLGSDPRVLETAQNRPQDLTMFHFNGVHILIIKYEGVHQLLFWENLTDLTRVPDQEHPSQPHEEHESDDASHKKEDLP